MTPFLTLDAIYITRTYAGVLEGIPDEAYVLDSARSQARALFGSDRPTYLRVDPHHQRLPTCRTIAWIIGPEMDKSMHGSHCVVIWFSDTPSLDPHTILGDTPWEDVAKDFEY